MVRDRGSRSMDEAIGEADSKPSTSYETREVSSDTQVDVARRWLMPGDHSCGDAECDTARKEFRQAQVYWPNMLKFVFTRTAHQRSLPSHSLSGKSVLLSSVRSPSRLFVGLSRTKPLVRFITVMNGVLQPSFGKRLTCLRPGAP